MRCWHDCDVSLLPLPAVSRSSPVIELVSEPSVPAMCGGYWRRNNCYTFVCLFISLVNILAAWPHSLAGCRSLYIPLSDLAPLNQTELIISPYAIDNIQNALNLKLLEPIMYNVQVYTIKVVCRIEFQYISYIKHWMINNEGECQIPSWKVHN